MKSLIIMILIGTALPTVGQTQFWSVLYKREKEIVTKCNCRLISLTYPFYMDPHHENIPGIGLTLIHQELYLFYTSNQSIFTKKLIEYFTESQDKHRIVESDPIELKNSSFFKQAFDSFPKFENENLVPYIYAWPDTSSNIRIYNILENTHADSYDMRAYDKNTDLEKTHPIDLIRTQQFYHSFPENLNYRHNTQTITYRLFTDLQRVIDSLEKGYKFR